MLPENMPRKIINEIKTHPFVYLLLLLIVSGGFILRVYNIDNLLGFYYDQGRDALKIWDISHGGNIPFIGPTTGIAGIFRGPFYYWLIAPFYLLGSGNPVWPSVFLSFTTVLAVILIYYLGFKIQDRTTGLIAGVLASFSFNIVLASRWLSNPTPMLLISLLLLWSMILAAEGKKKTWPWIFFLSGIALFHFGSAGEVFYFPAILILVVWRRKNFFTKKNLIYSALALLLTALPLIAFDIKNNGILLTNIKNFLFDQGSFKLPSWRFIGDKISFYYDVFTNKIFNGRYEFEKTLLSIIALFGVYHLHKLIKNKAVKVLLLLLGSVCFGLIFFQGNFGNIYDYYLTGYYLPFILLFSIVLGYMWRFKLGKIFIIYFLYVFLTNNADVLRFKLTDRGLGPNSISFIAQKQAVDWIKSDSYENGFNVDVYVPPVIPYAYDYLFLWRGVVQSREQTPLLYTLYEKDPDHQDRLDAWLARQKEIAQVVETRNFGGIVVQKRIRLN